MFGKNFKKQRVLIILILILFNGTIRAQFYTMFWNTQSLYNPASSGVLQKYYSALMGRAQWVGFKGAPISATEIFDMKLNALHGGVGINYTYDEIAFTKSHTINVNYGYHINLQNERTLSLGVSGGLTREKTDLSSMWMPPDPDPLLTSEVETSTLFNFKFGLFYKSNHWEAGLSSTHAKGTQLGYHSSTIRSNYWLVCSYRFDLGEDFSIKPNLLLATSDSKNNSLSSGLLMMYKERFWAGISHTVNSNIGFVAGFDIMGQFRVGYSFDKSTSGIPNGNHEIILAVMLK